MPTRDFRPAARFSADVAMHGTAASATVADAAACPEASGLIMRTQRNRHGVSAQALIASIKGVSTNA